ncbi:MAG: EAL domain-containing protein [Proteobacteria bacterium]|nr:EAL domain-containing protein [Pseudomonadota bacterium]MBU1612767.1 EAL domain-containing protein [Pseudomonadota bacterium]
MRVLIVEDNEDDAILLLRHLKKSGFDITHRIVQTREAMEKLLDGEPWDIIISDYNMPSFDGLAALKLVTDKGLDIPFIVISGAIGEESAVELLHAGAADFIKKGNWARLVPAIRRELREARHRRERAQAREDKFEAEARYTALFENAVEGIFQSTPDGRFLAVNPAMARILGYTEPETVMAEFTNINEQLYTNPHRREELMRQLQEHGSVAGFEAQVFRRDNSIIWISIHARAVFTKDGAIEYMEGMFEDITTRKNAEDMLYQNAFYDQLTGLPNRALLTDRLRRVLEGAKRQPDTKYALLFLDLDQFKNVNDSLGHQAGDELLLAVGNKLKKCLRAMDTVARFGGDEFALLLEDLQDYKMALKVTRRIQSELTTPQIIQNREVYSSASIGIVLGTKPFESADAVLRAADVAMYQAKRQGRNRFKVFNHRMGRKAARQLELETSLRQAINHEQFEVHYQPIIEVISSRIVGVEALVRWRRPEVGLVLPRDFIPLCEETGLINFLGHWVLVTACAQTKVWQSIPNHKDLFVCVNISGTQIQQPGLVEQVQWAFEDAELDPNLLKLEITESVLMSNAQKAVNMLAKLKTLGVCLAIDDFGTGYSSLAYLNRFPVDTLKIDRSFVSRMGHDDDDKIVQAVISLAETMGMDAVAEGVEQLDQLEKLTAMHCAFAQGFYFSRPLPPSELELFLKHGLPAHPTTSD